jgi:pyruvate/2-oxoglutarate dehydrogenase complex dihydrolipoamide dehydrogenase (E3) component
VVGGGPAGIAAAVEAGLAGHEVVLVERRARLGGQIALAGASPGNAELARSFLDNARRQLADARVDVRLGAAGLDGLEPDAVVVATGARPYHDPRLELHGLEVVHAWDVLSGHVPSGRVVVADWGGDPGGLDAAELIAVAGGQVVLAVASVAIGEGIHQYRRNLYLQRLYRSGVAVAHHLELARAADRTATFRNVFAPELEMTFAADALVLALGRVPEEMPTMPGVRVERAGDCLSPRSLEEAVLEGTLAARRAVS